VFNGLVANVHNHLTYNMRCILCHPMALASSSSNTTQSKKGIFSYNHANDITSMKKHVDDEHGATMT